VPSDERFRLRGDAVAEAVERDRAAGLRPHAIAAVCGSTNTGSIDETGELADLAEREDLWLHVDAAYGGAARLSARAAPLVPDLERAHSVTVDPHKWFFQAYDIGGLVVRDREDLVRTFHTSPEYYRSTRPEHDPLNWYQYSMEGTRRFRALKLWFSWKHLGTEGFGRLIDHTLALAAHMTRRIAESDDFVAMPAAPDLSIVCFRHVPGGRDREASLDATALDTYQDRLQRALEVSGRGWVSTTTLRGRTYLRAGLVNHLSTEDDVDRVLDTLRESSAQAAREAGLPAE
jgi:glutamate/tyrosine decarboxylase-like PLP-dependent enzyme